MGEILMAKIIRLCIVRVFITWHCIIPKDCLVGCAPSPSAWDQRIGTEKGGEKQGGKPAEWSPRERCHCLPVPPDPAHLRRRQEGFGSNPPSELGCWKSDTVNADNKLWKACHCLLKGSLRWPYELTTVMGAEAVIVIFFIAQALLISFCSFLKKT